MIGTIEPGFLSVGQHTAERTARNSATRGELGRTLLVHGPPGAGKRAFVDDLLALMLCAAPGTADRPCNSCRGCRDARARSHPDLLVASPESWREARTTGESIVGAARRWLLDAAGAPIIAARRVVLIEGADRANEQTQNALLKVLEEPGDRHAFVLVADEPQRLLPTIRSRCRALRIGPVARQTLVAHLVDMQRLPKDLADAIAQLSGGLSGRATSMVEHREWLDWRRRTQAVLLDMLERGRAERFGAVRDLLDEASRMSGPPSVAVTTDDTDAGPTPSAQREAAALVVAVWMDLARDLLVAAAGRKDLAPAREMSPDLGSTAARLKPADLTSVLERLERVHEALRQNAAPRLALETLMLEWPHLSGGGG